MSITWKSYLVAAAAVVAALAARLLLDPYLGNQLPYVTFFVAVTVVAWYEGLGPTLFTILAGACVSDYFFLTPRHSFALAGTANQLGFCIYFLVTLPTAFLAYRQKRDARARAQAEERLLREEAVRESEGRFRTLADAIPQLCWMAEANGYISWYNQRWFEYTGTTPDEMKGWGWKSVHHPASLPQVLERWEGSIATGMPFDMVFPLKGGDGVFRPFLTRVMPLRDAEGKVIRWFGTNTDISEQKKIEDELRKSNERLDLAISVASVGEWEIDLEERTGTRSRRHEEIFGKSSCGSEWSFESFLNQVLPEHRAEVAENVKRALLDGAWDFETEIRRTDGAVRWIWARGRSLSDETGKPVRMYGTVMDITDRKHAVMEMEETRLRAERSAAQLRTVLDNMEERLYVCDPEGNLIVANEAARSTYSKNEAEPPSVVGMNDQIEVTYLDGRPMSKADWPISRVMRGEQLHGAEIRVHFIPTGVDLVLSCNGSPIRDREGKLVMAVLTSADITERKRAEQQIRELNLQLEDRVRQRTAELESANQELEAFSYSVSHDLRAPLRAIDGFSQAVVEDYGPLLPDEGREYLETICRGAKRMGELIDDLLSFSRLSRQPLSRSEIDTRDLVSQCLEELAVDSGPRAIGLSLGDLPPCQGDRALLKQVWTNLLSNAIKFTGHNACASVEVGTRCECGETVYFVKDNGAGFDMKYANKLFGVFQRLHRADEFEGTGVGLAIVQRIVHRHGGRVWADAALDRGATFYFTVGEEDHREI